MTIRLDATTETEYRALTTAAARASAVVAALVDPVTVTVYNDADEAMGDGTMAAPWATASGATITIGELSEFAVTTTGTPSG